MNKEFQILVLSALNFLLGNRDGDKSDQSFYEDWLERQRKVIDSLKPE